jgi:pimeloyl-ACP methyl ester carboxylesterase
MLHGIGTTGNMCGYLASALIEDRMVVAPDLRGLGLSSKPDGGYDKKNQAADVVGVLDELGVRTAGPVTHDVGTWSASQLPPPLPSAPRRLCKLHMTHRHGAVNESHWPSPVVLARLSLTAAGRFRPTGGHAAAADRHLQRVINSAVPII